MNEYWVKKKLEKEKAKNKRKKELTYNNQVYRSKDEVRIAKQLDEESVANEYEKFKLDYIVPESKHKYTPDFKLRKYLTDPDGTLYWDHIYIECKGVGPRDGLTLVCRKKMLHVKKCNPEADIRFVFSNPYAKINPKSPTTYAMWCDKNGFPWAHQFIPAEWIKETGYK